MPEGRLIPHHGEAIVLRTWPFHEADLLVSIFTRDQGKVKGVARHAMKSRKRFGGALEPATHVRAHYTERPRQDLVRLDQFEILWSPLSAPIDTLRLAGLQLIAEVLEEAMPELAPDDNIFRLALTCLTAISTNVSSRPESAFFADAAERPVICAVQNSGCPIVCPEPVEGSGFSDMGSQNACAEKKSAPSQIYLPVTYFCLWMNRLMGWMPELGHCAACGLDLRGETVFWSPTADGVTCSEDRRSNSQALTAASVAESHRIARTPLADLTTEPWLSTRAADLRAFAIGMLERHLERRLRSAARLT